jgi:hypothetical protein
LNGRVAGGRPVAWEDAGRQIAPVLGSYSAVVVTSSDPLAAAYVALGVARAEAARRRVVVGDLVGDLAPLTSLLADDDPHGISDSILYGVSINKVARAVKDVENLFIAPSGTEQVVSEDVLASNRWKRLADGFTASGGLLLLVARSDSPGLGSLIDSVDGAVVVRDSIIAAAPSSLILARVASPTRTLKVPFVREVKLPPLKSVRGRLHAAPVAAGVLVVVLAAAVVFRMLGEREEAPSVVAPPAIARVAALADTTFVGLPVNIADSASAAAFAVELLVANTPEGANFVVRKDRAALPSATVAPIPIGPERTTWYKVIAGAYTRRSEADSLLLALRRSSVLTDSAGSVLRVPLALLVDSVDSQGGMSDAVTTAVGRYTAQGLSVYPLLQNGGGARLYSGAFERPQDAAELLKTLRAAGLEPMLVYRTGRAP